MNNDEITNKILESGFIEAFFDKYQFDRNSLLSTEDKLKLALVITRKDKEKVLKKIIKKTKQNIELSCYNDLSTIVLTDSASFDNLKLIFCNYYKKLVKSFTPVIDFIENYDGRCSLQEFYEEFYDLDIQPNNKNVNDISNEENNLIEEIFSYILTFEIFEDWNIEIKKLKYYSDYSIEILQLFDLGELYVQIIRYINFKNLLEELSTKEIVIKTDSEVQNISFSKKLEDFFIQTNYCLVLSPEPFLLGKKGNIDLVLPPQQFFKIINDYKIEYPFLIDVKIQELKSLMKSENISINEGITIFDSFKNHYNPIDSVFIFQPVLDLFNRGLKINNPSINEIEIIKEQVELNKYFIAIKNDFHNKLYHSLFNNEQNTVSEKSEVIVDIKKNKKISVKYYVLTYILDCRANNEKIESKKNNLIILGDELLKNEITKGTTFYRVFNDYSNIIKNIIDDNSNNKKISTDFDLDWKDIVLQLSKNKDILHKYILEKKLM